MVKIYAITKLIGKGLAGMVITVFDRAWSCIYGNKHYKSLKYLGLDARKPVFGDL